MNKKHQHLQCFMTSITFQQLLPVQIDVYECVWVCLKAWRGNRGGSSIRAKIINSVK